MIVADTNLLAYLALPSEHTEEARRTLRRDPQWAVPRLWRSEFRNVLAGHLRRRRLELAHALELVAAVAQVVEGAEFEPDSAAVLALVQRSRCSAYDCEFVALAQELKVPLVTSDRRIIADFPDTAVSLARFGAE